MKNGIIVGGAVFLLAAGTGLGADVDVKTSDDTKTDREVRKEERTEESFFRANELSFDGFGTIALGQQTINHLSGSRIRHDGRLGGGLGLNYFVNRYIGVGAEGYTENVDYHFIDNIEGNLILRWPLDPLPLAPYVFGGGGHKWDPVKASFGHAGAGLEFRFTPNFGIFADARYVFMERTRNYGLGRAGVRFSF